MLLWIVAGAGLFLAAQFGRRWSFRRTLRGFSSGTIYRSPITTSAKHSADEEHLRCAINLFLNGESFDMLWVSWTRDERQGLTLTKVTGPPVLVAGFQTKRQQLGIKSFKEAVAQRNLALVADSLGFNGGLSEHHRVSILQYALPSSSEQIFLEVKIALECLRGSASHEYVLKGWLFADGVGSTPKRDGRHIADPLGQLAQAAFHLR